MEAGVTLITVIFGYLSLNGRGGHLQAWVGGARCRPVGILPARPAVLPFPSFVPSFPRPRALGLRRGERCFPPKGKVSPGACPFEPLLPPSPPLPVAPPVASLPPSSHTTSVPRPATPHRTANDATHPTNSPRRRHTLREGARHVRRTVPQGYRPRHAPQGTR